MFTYKRGEEVKKLLIVVLCVGSWELQAMRGGFREDTIESPTEEQPRSRGVVDSIKNGWRKLMSLLPGKPGSTITPVQKPSSRSVPVEGDSTRSTVVNFPSMALDGVSAKEVQAIRNAGKPKVSFVDQLRSLSGRRNQPQPASAKTVEEIEKEIKEIDERVSELRELMSDRRRNPISAKEVLRLLEVRKKLQQQLQEKKRKLHQDADQENPKLAIQRMRDSKRPFLIQHALSKGLSREEAEAEADRLLADVRDPQNIQQKKDKDNQEKNQWKDSHNDEIQRRVRWGLPIENDLESSKF